MNRAHDLAMRGVDVRTPGFTTHRRPAPLDIRARASVKNDGVPCGQFFLDLIVAHEMLSCEIAPVRVHTDTAHRPDMRGAPNTRRPCSLRLRQI